MSEGAWENIIERCLDPNESYIIALDNSVLHDTRLLQSLRGSGCFVAVLDEQQPITSEQELMNQIGKTCGFEWYSRNWDAMLDWLSEFYWLPDFPCYLLVLYAPLSLPKSVRAKFFEIVEDASSCHTDHGGGPLKVVTSNALYGAAGTPESIC